MSLYSQATESIRQYAESRQRELDSAASAARAECIDAQRAAILALAPDGSPFRAVAELVAHTLRISDDGKRLELPSDTRDVVVAALAAGWRDPSCFYGNTGEVCRQPNIASWEAYRSAKRRADSYRAAQTYSNL